MYAVQVMYTMTPQEYVVDKIPSSCLMLLCSKAIRVHSRKSCGK